MMSNDHLIITLWGGPWVITASAGGKPLPKGSLKLAGQEDSGADPGFRKGGGGHTFRRGGGVVQEFQERIQIVAGPWANQQAKKNCREP